MGLVRLNSLDLAELGAALESPMAGSRQRTSSVETPPPSAPPIVQDDEVAEAAFARAQGMLEILRERDELFGPGVSQRRAPMDDDMSFVSLERTSSGESLYSGASYSGASEGAPPRAPDVAPVFTSSANESGGSPGSDGSPLPAEVSMPLPELETMFSNLTRRELPSGEQALRLVRAVRDYLRDECRALMHLDAPAGRLIVVGDLHGHFNDLLHVRHQFGMPSSHNMFLFNGDFVDRGVWGPEVLLTLFCYKLMYKKYVHLNRGNHESVLCTNVYGFKTHLACAYPHHHHLLEPIIQEAFDELPLCYVIGHQIFVVHGGLPKFDVTLDEIAALQRGPVPFPGRLRSEALFQALLWSDPKPAGGPSDRGLGWHFPPSVTRRFLRANHLRHLIRSHECHDSGCTSTHAGMITTVFSASNYLLNNSACVAIVDAKLNVSTGDAWNEAYVKAEWLDEQDLRQLCRTDLGDSEGFTDYEVSVVVSPGQDLGVEFSLESPHLEIPVVIDIFENGCFATYNLCNPDRRIKIGDAVVEVNGESGYIAIVANLLRQSELRFKMRRPQRIDLQVARADCPASTDMLKFPTGGFAYSLFSWGRAVSRFDRIVAVNGRTSGPDMQHALATETALNLRLFRYAPPDLCAATPDERRESVIRRRSSAYWEDRESTRRAVEALQKRLGESEHSQEASRDTVLKELRALIWAHRPRLLEAFQTFDRTSLDSVVQEAAGPDYDPDITGAVEPAIWARVLGGALRTPADFPWAELRPHLAELTADGLVSYMDFLSRFRNPLESWLTRAWCETALDRIAHAVDRSPSAVFDSLDADGDGKVSYVSLRPFFRKRLYAAEAASRRERRARDVQCFALYRHFASRRATISRRRFVGILAARAPPGSKHCAAGHRLALARHGLFSASRVCDGCGAGIGAWGESRHCPTCDFDLCKSCYLDRRVRDQVHVVAQREAGTAIMESWYRLDAVLSALIVARCDVARLFATEGARAGDIRISRDRFVGIVSELVGGDGESAAELYNCIARYLEEEGSGSTDDGLRVSELVEALRIVDTAVEGRRRPSAT